jgi:hypothetical protein
MKRLTKSFSEAAEDVAKAAESHIADYTDLAKLVRSSSWLGADVPIQSKTLIALMNRMRASESAMGLAYRNLTYVLNHGDGA